MRFGLLLPGLLCVDEKNYGQNAGDVSNPRQQSHFLVLSFRQIELMTGNDLIMKKHASTYHVIEKALQAHRLPHILK